MLSRHGTRLELGTAEDIAELNAAEALLRASNKSSTVAGCSSDVGGGSPGIGGGSYHTRVTSYAPGNLPASGNDAYSGGVPSVGVGSTAGGAPHASPTSVATVTTDFAGTAVGGGARSNVGMLSGTAAAPPHVNLGYPSGPHSSTVANPGSASAPSSASGYPQRALYPSGPARSEEGSPPGRTAGTSSAGTAVRRPGGGTGLTGVVTSSSSGLRATAPPFYGPYTSAAGVMYRSGTASASGAEEDKGREGSEDVGNAERDVERGRSSMRGFYAPSPTTTPPYPTIAAGARLPRPQQSQRAHASPYAYHAPHDSAVAGRAGAVRGGRGSMQGGRGDDEDNEEASSRPSRVSGRYQFTRPDVP
ncbi:hypothetical protein LSCM1_06918 [Leishmania martiniquensis]|uniref:Uncharacterized protein n=1 Tax=Leishmania martiniquensis TaxID=1580590 RepID=A0A836KPI4_9TRYP|nr:hypothetical protein LSCM1_06918 [Leishmania martiniquensis]